MCDYQMYIRYKENKWEAAWRIAFTSIIALTIFASWTFLVFQFSGMIKESEIAREQGDRNIELQKQVQKPTTRRR